MNIDVKYIDDKFKVMLNCNNYKDVSKIIDYVIIEKYDKDNRTSSVPSGYGSKKEFPIGKRSCNKKFLKGIQKNYVEETIEYIKTLMPVKHGERIWIDFASRFLDGNNVEFTKKELHGGIRIDASNFEVELNNFINWLNCLISENSFEESNENIQNNKRCNAMGNLIIPKPVTKKDDGMPKKLNRKRKRELKDLI